MNPGEPRVVITRIRKGNILYGIDYMGDIIWCILLEVQGSSNHTITVAKPLK